MTKTYTVIEQRGLYAKAATAFVNECSRYEDDVLMTCNGVNVDAKSILGVMSLGLRLGDSFELCGDDSAINALETILKDNKII